jgi:hypothetical protein
MPKAKCTPYYWCAHMTSVMTEANRAGINPVVVTNLAGKSRMVAVAFKRTARDRGLCLNFCPFCGVKIAPSAKKFYPPA